MINENLKTQKSNLAKLMASENITVLHKKIPTAYFDVKNRVLACPTFKDDMSNELYDLFMGHEVGHALHTPYEGLHSTLKDNATLKGYLNVVEDVRIERKIRERFSGLRKSFFKAYDELMQRDFFGLNGRDLQTLSLIDKINLITKCGSRVSITLTDEEKVFLEAAEKCETWEDVVQVATAIYEWSKENEVRDQKDEAITNTHYLPEDEDEDNEYDEDFEEQMSDGYGDDEEDEDGEELETEEKANGDKLPEIDEEDEEVEEESDKELGKKGGAGSHDDEDGAREALTEHFAHNNEDQFIDENAVAKTYFQPKNFDELGNNIVYSYKRVIKDWEDYTKKLSYKVQSADSYDKEYNQKELDTILTMGPKMRNYFKNKNKKIVSHMAKEFEMRQTAQKAIKAQVAKSGELDMNKLAKYQIIDDVFKRVTYVPEGQNHGVNVLVDWSGSICREVKDIIEQFVILAEFCNKVNIPFRVYLFSDHILSSDDKYSYVSNGAALVEIFSNEMPARQYVKMLEIVGLIYLTYWHDSVGYNSWYDNDDDNPKYNEITSATGLSMRELDSKMVYHMGPHNYRLGGTPLDTCLVGLRKILPEFNKKYNVEKSILTVITDGFSHGADCLYEQSEERDEFRSQCENGDTWSIKRERYLIDPITKKPFIYSTNGGYERNGFKQTQNLLDWLSKTCHVSVTGYFIFSKKREFLNSLSIMLSNDDYWKLDKDAMWRDTRKTGYVLEIPGYNKLFLQGNTSLSASSDDGLSEELEGAKKGRILAAFKKNQKSKTTTRFLTTEFIKEIA